MLLCSAVSIDSWAQQSQAADEGNQVQRIVFLGDSITDGHTYPSLVQQALKEAGKPVPQIFNAGIGGDTAKGMSGRLDEDVFAHRPTLVTLSAGINDVLRDVTLEDYQGHITTIADQLKTRKVPLVLLTTSAYGPKHEAAEKRVAQFNTWIRQFGAARGLKVADVFALFLKTRSEPGSPAIMESDDVHPNYEGQRLMARAVLDALGHQDVAVPAVQNAALLPGVVGTWKLRLGPDDKGWTDAEAQQLSEQALEAPHVFEAWTTYALPEEAPQNEQWKDQDRKRGVAMNLELALGKAKLYQGVAWLNNGPEASPVYLNVGALLNKIWLNGKPVYQSKGWRGWHPGRERVKVELAPGSNILLMESGAQFFLSVTPDREWG